MTHGFEIHPETTHQVTSQPGAFAVLDREPAGAHVGRAVLSYLWNQVENGVGCPTGMAYASIPSLRLVPEIRELWLDKVLAADYDPRPVPVAEKPAVADAFCAARRRRLRPRVGHAPGRYRRRGHHRAGRLN